MPPKRLPRPTPKTRYSVQILNGQVEKDWNTLLEQRRSIAIRCWDHISENPLQPIGGRYTPLQPPMNTVRIGDRDLPQWQYEIDNGARVRVAIGKDVVTVVRVSSGHPKDNE